MKTGPTEPSPEKVTSFVCLFSRKHLHKLPVSVCVSVAGFCPWFPGHRGCFLLVNMQEFGVIHFFFYAR